MSKSTTDRYPVEGTVEVCCHVVDYRYETGDLEITADLKERLEAEAEERAKHCITEGCHSGELNCLYVNDEGEETIEEEVRGWWEIRRE